MTEPTITQADRDAAADFISVMQYPASPYRGLVFHDGLHIVQAFAAHREAAVAELRAEVERLEKLARANNSLARHEADGKRKLQAENARMKDALEACAECDPESAMFARAALAQKETSHDD